MSAWGEFRCHRYCYHSIISIDPFTNCENSSNTALADKGSISMRKTSHDGATSVSTSSTSKSFMVELYHNEMGGPAGQPDHPLLFRSAELALSILDPFLEPVQHFFLNPSHPVGTKLYPLGEFAGRLETCDVLRRIENHLLQLPFR